MSVVSPIAYFKSLDLLNIGRPRERMIENPSWERKAQGTTARRSSWIQPYALAASGAAERHLSGTELEPEVAAELPAEVSRRQRLPG